MMFIPQHSINPYQFTKKIDYMPTKRWRVSTKRLSEDITRSIWSPVVWKPNYRKSANFIKADWLVLDFDHGTKLNDAINRFCDINHIIGTTTSHTENHHKFRVCLLFERPIQDYNTYHFNISYHIDQNEADNTCKDGARGFFPCRDIVSINRDCDAYRIEVKKPPDGYRQWEIVPLEDRELSLFVRRQVMRIIPVGERDTTTWQIARDLARARYSRNEAKSFIYDAIKYEQPFDFAAKVDTAYNQMGKEFHAKKN